MDVFEAKKIRIKLYKKWRKQMSEPIPISMAKNIAEKYDYDQVFIFARKTGDGGIEHMTTLWNQ